jgi:hypothetical protein
LSITPSQTPVEHRESQSGKQFIDDQVDGQFDCAVSITLDNLGAANMVTFLQSTLTTISSGSVSAEAKTAPAAGQSFLLDNPVVSAFTSLTGSGGTPTYVNNTDYVRDGAQVYIPAGSALAAGGVAVLANYTKGAASNLDLFGAANKNYFFYFNGINTSNNKKVTVKLWKVRFQVAELAALISDQYLTAPITGRALYEPLKANVSNLAGFGQLVYEN